MADGILRSTAPNGFHGFELHRSVEKLQRYRLTAKWETLENHTVEVPLFGKFVEWRAPVANILPPSDVEHTNFMTSVG